MLTITAQEIVRFTASARIDITHLEFTKSHNVVSSQTLQERSVNSEEDKDEEEKARKAQSESGVSGWTR